MDESRLRGAGEAFWRCQNCGDRFIGPTPERTSGGDERRGEASDAHHHHRRRHHHHHHHDLTSGRNANGRLILTILLALAGIIAIVFLLDTRSPRSGTRVGAPR